MERQVESKFEKALKALRDELEAAPERILIRRNTERSFTIQVWPVGERDPLVGSADIPNSEE